jgi:Na+/H+-dicarboxylate symporter
MPAKPIQYILSMKLHWQILIALVVGVAVGLPLNHFGGAEVTLAGNLTYVGIFNFIGNLFLRALKMIIVPLIAASIITGVAGVGSAKNLGRLGGKTFAYYICTTLMAILVGLLLVNVVKPGVIDGEPARSRLGLASQGMEALESKVEGRGFESLVEIFVRMIPENPIRAAAEGDILAVIFFCLLFGFFINLLQDPHKQSLKTFFEALFAVMMKITHFVMCFAPLGVFGLIAKTTATTGLDSFTPLAKYFCTVCLALGIHFFVVLPLMLRLIGRVDPLKQYRAMAPALLTAFSTSSSSATLPLTMECAEKNAGVSNRVTSFVLPLGATVNMDGTALYECVAAMFIAQAYGLHMSFSVQLIVVITALLASIGAAGIPSAGLVMIGIILNALNWPLEGMLLILAVDRPLDMARTAVNVFSDSCGCVVVARSEGESPLQD